jgi:hypothetical protein
VVADGYKPTKPSDLGVAPEHFRWKFLPDRVAIRESATLWEIKEHRPWE